MNQTSTFFSVIIPCYNAEKKIGKALQSLLNQTFSNFEVIVVLDGCTDQTLATVNQYANTFSERNIKFEVINNPNNAGPAACRNMGWERSKGRYVVFLDADDEFLPNKLEVLKKTLTDLDFPPVLGHQAKLPNTQPAETHATRTLSFFQFLAKNRIFTPCLCVRADLPDRFDSSMRYCEDHALLLQLSYKYKVYFLETVLTTIHREILSAGGLSANYDKMRLGEMKAYTNIIKLNPVFFILIPFLIIYSTLKHVRFLTYRFLRN